MGVHSALEAGSQASLHLQASSQAAEAGGLGPSCSLGAWAALGEVRC